VLPGSPPVAPLRCCEGAVVISLLLQRHRHAARSSSQLAIMCYTCVQRYASGERDDAEAEGDVPAGAGFACVTCRPHMGKSQTTFLDLERPSHHDSLFWDP
jgi:hypothetical protein